MFGINKKSTMVNAADALPGRSEAMPVPATHFVNGHSMQGPFPEGMETVVFALGCFWGAERCFWELPGVYSTAVGYIAGYTSNPTYEEVCSGLTGHTEAVLVVFDPKKISFTELLTTFWESHNPTQGMRQGNDAGTQYRSGIYTSKPEQLALAEETRAEFQSRLNESGFGNVTSEIVAATEFYYAEAYHQQYLAKNPGGYCGLGGTGVCLR
jgi:peptide-methionine (S)-S-oxide reductase